MYEELIDNIMAVIKRNGREEITGNILQDVLVGIVRNIGGLKFGGIYRDGDVMEDNTFYLVPPGNYGDLIDEEVTPGSIGIFWLRDGEFDWQIFSTTGYASVIAIAPGDGAELPEDNVLYFCKPGDYGEFVVPKGQFAFVKNGSMRYLSPVPLWIDAEPDNPYYGQIFYEETTDEVLIYTPGGWKKIN